jgi:hypothetical protein
MRAGGTVRVAAQLAGACLLLASAGLAVVDAVSAASTPSATVSPSSGLIDGQHVAITGAGFPPNKGFIQVEECTGTASNPPADNTACEGDTLDVQAGTDVQGNYSNVPGDARGHTGYVVYALPSPLIDAPTTITCDATHPCVLYVGVDQNDFTQPHSFVGISFTTTNHPSAPATTRPPMTTVAPATQTTPTAPQTTTPFSPPTTALSQASSRPQATTAGAGTAVSLAQTGGPSTLPLVAAGGLLLLFVGAVLGRRARGLSSEQETLL